MYTTKKNNFSLLKSCSAWLLLTVALLLIGCNEIDEPVMPPPAGDEVTVSIKLNVPGMKIPTTYAGDVPPEQKIDTVDVVVFTDNGVNFLTRIEGVVVKEGMGDGNRAAIYATLPQVSNCNLVVVANARQSVNDAIAALGMSFVKTAFLEKLTLNFGTHWPTETGAFRSLPMYGESGVMNITATLSSAAVKVDLLRMMARIDVKMDDPASALKAVHLYSYKKAGYIAPMWNPATGAVDFTPVIPNIPNVPENNTTAFYSYAYNVESGATEIAKKIYTFEAEPTTDNATYREYHPGLVVAATYGGTTYYYRVNFTAEDGNYLPLLRNHKYVVRISNVDGKGYLLADDAWKANTVSSNLKVKILEYNEGEYSKWVFDGQNMLAVSCNTLNLTNAAYATPNLAEVAVFSDYEPTTSSPIIWNAALVDAGFGTSWLQFYPTSGGTVNFTNHKDIVRLSVNSNPSDARRAILRITSGLLSKDVIIEQSN